ncbi:MAG: 50S ribosomal protein L32 [bacterium]|nr:50S ribosomal protein L32 [bacterium]
MPVPKKRHSTARQGKRRASHRYSLPSLVACANCHAPILSHYVCPHCHIYKGENFAKIIKGPKNAEKKTGAKEKKEEVKKTSRRDVLRDEERPIKATPVQKKVGRVHRKPDSS